jgi:hypothetical protein
MHTHHLPVILIPCCVDGTAPQIDIEMKADGEGSHANAPAVALGYAYLGSLAQNVGDVVSGRVRLSLEASTLSMVITGVSIALTLGLATLYTKRTIQRCEYTSKRSSLPCIAVPSTLQRQQCFPDKCIFNTKEPGPLLRLALFSSVLLCSAQLLDSAAIKR